MKIYTKTGDKGHTSLIGGRRVPKNHQRIEAYGTVDELIAFLGLLRDNLSKQDLQSKIIKIQDDLMICAAILATDCMGLRHAQTGQLIYRQCRRE